MHGWETANARAAGPRCDLTIASLPLTHAFIPQWNMSSTDDASKKAKRPWTDPQTGNAHHQSFGAPAAHAFSGGAGLGVGSGLPSSGGGSAHSAAVAGGAPAANSEDVDMTPADTDDAGSPGPAQPQ